MSDNPIYDDDFSQLPPDEFLEEAPDEEDIQADNKPINLPLARPRFYRQPPSAGKEVTHEKEDSETHHSESQDTDGNDTVVDAESPAAEIAAEENPSEEAVTYRYRIALVLSPDIEVQVNRLRQGVNLPDAEMGLMTLLPDFRTESIEEVQETLEAWVQDNLPIELNLDGVEAKVTGSQRYTAAWTLTPPEKLIQAQEALLDNLKPSVQIDAESVPFQSRLIVSDHTSPKIFPVLIRDMQRSFEPLTWQVEAVELLRVPEGDTRWEVLEKFS